MPLIALQAKRPTQQNNQHTIQRISTGSRYTVAAQAMRKPPHNWNLPKPHKFATQFMPKGPVTFANPSVQPPRCHPGGAASAGLHTLT